MGLQNGLFKNAIASDYLVNLRVEVFRNIEFKNLIINTGYINYSCRII